MSLRSLTTCSYVSDATSFAMRHCTIVVTPLPMSPEPESFRSRDFIMDLHGPDVGITLHAKPRPPVSLDTL